MRMTGIRPAASAHGYHDARSRSTRGEAALLPEGAHLLALGPHFSLDSRYGDAGYSAAGRAQRSRANAAIEGRNS